MTADQLAYVLLTNGEPHREPFPDDVRGPLEDRVARLCAGVGIPPLRVLRASEDHNVFMVGWGESAVLGVGIDITAYPSVLLDATLTHEIRHHVNDHSYANFQAAERLQRWQDATRFVANRGQTMSMRARWAAREQGSAAALSVVSLRAGATVANAGAQVLRVGSMAGALGVQALSRHRELTADREAAQSMGDSAPMAAAILRAHAEQPRRQPDTLVGRVTSTHPSIDVRMRNLARANRVPVRRALIRGAAAKLGAFGEAGRRLRARGDRSLG